MSISATTRQASVDEIAAEMDRRGQIIESLEAERDRLSETAQDLLEALVRLEGYLRNTPHHNAMEAAAARKSIRKAAPLRQPWGVL